MSGKWKYRVNVVNGPQLEMENLEGLVSSFGSLDEAIRSCKVVLSVFLSSEIELQRLALARPQQIWISVSSLVSEKRDDAALAEMASKLNVQYLALMFQGPVESFGTAANLILVEHGNAESSRDLHDLVSSMGAILEREKEEL